MFSVGQFVVVRGEDEIFRILQSWRSGGTRLYLIGRIQGGFLTYHEIRKEDELEPCNIFSEL